ncbi:D-amino acid dehydrogenase [Paenalcaligenes hominis]|uniref:D-amino acid dehydrogenase n=1 Tax=Paenalcaligenes hominis TaxID=643674 RepID=UPI00352389B9
MKVLVLGAGVAGVCSAYYLAKQGHSVTVIDRLEGSAMETSFGNAGQVSFGYASPWAAPGIPLKAAKWLFAEHPPFSFKPDGSLYQLQWMLKMWANCTPAHYKINKERMVRVADYSRKCLAKLREDTHIQYEARQKGTLQLFRTDEQMAASEADMRVLQEMGVAFQLLGRDQLSSAEPALELVKEKFVGGLRSPDDETGDCRLFTLALTKMAEELGVEFRFNESIQQIQRQGDTITGVISNNQLITADAYLVCLGSWSRPLLRNIAPIPVYPLKGYSITVPIADPDFAPQSTLLDESYKIALTRFDNRIRVGGMAEVAGFDKTLNPKRQATLLMVLNDLFPKASHEKTDVNFWTGLRPKTPDSVPIIGKGPAKNLYLNSGHGTLGWTMSTGSARLIADIISGNEPEIRVDDLNLSRYQ